MPGESPGCHCPGWESPSDHRTWPRPPEVKLALGAQHLAQPARPQVIGATAHDVAHDLPAPACPRWRQVASPRPPSLEPGTLGTRSPARGRCCRSAHGPGLNCEHQPSRSFRPDQFLISRRLRTLWRNCEPDLNVCRCRPVSPQPLYSRSHVAASPSTSIGHNPHYRYCYAQASAMPPLDLLLPVLCPGSPDPCPAPLPGDLLALLPWSAQSALPLPGQDRWRLHLSGRANLEAQREGSPAPHPPSGGRCYASHLPARFRSTAKRVPGRR